MSSSYPIEILSQQVPHKYFHPLYWTNIMRKQKMSPEEKKIRHRIRSYRTFLENKQLDPDIIEHMVQEHMKGNVIPVREANNIELDEPSSNRTSFYVLVDTSPINIGLFGPFKVHADAQKYKVIYERAVQRGRLKVEQVLIDYPFIKMLWEIDKATYVPNIVTFPQQNQ